MSKKLKVAVAYYGDIRLLLDAMTRASEVASRKPPQNGTVYLLDREYLDKAAHYLFKAFCEPCVVGAGNYDYDTANPGSYFGFSEMLSFARNYLDKETGK